jgi:CBS domain-containing protein
MVDKCPVVGDDDIRAALKELKVYVDVTEEDLRKIYMLALKRANERMVSSRPVGEAMNPDVISVRRDTGLDEAARLLTENRISGLPVVDDSGRVVGVISEADMICMARESGHSFRDVLKHLLGEPLHEHRAGNKVEDIMSSPAITTTPEADIKEAARVMTEKRIKRLPVVDGEGRLVGIISRADIVRAMGE